MSPHGSESGFHRRLGFGRRPALLVVDVCRAYFEPESPLFLGKPEVLEQIAGIVAAARGARVPVLWTRVVTPSDRPPSVFRRKVAALGLFEPGNPMGEWVDSLRPSREEVIVTKEHASAFFGTELIERLGTLRIDTLVITGVSTSGCVRASAVDACQHDLVPIVVDEACGDRTDEVHRRTLDDLDAKYADACSAADVLEYFGGR